MFRQEHERELIPLVNDPMVPRDQLAQRAYALALAAVVPAAQSFTLPEGAEKQLELATTIAAQCWQDETTKHLVMEPALAEVFARNLAAWLETGAYFSRAEEFYRDLLDEVGQAIGPDAFKSDDGSVQDEPVRLNLPGLVRKLVQENAQLKGDIQSIESVQDRAEGALIDLMGHEFGLAIDRVGHERTKALRDQWITNHQNEAGDGIHRDQWLAYIDALRALQPEAAASGANVHGIGPDVGGGPNPHYVPEDESAAPSDASGSSESADAGQVTEVQS
jgi:hypothetical protein